VLLLSSSLLAFFSLKFMPVGEFTAIVMITPLVITLLAATKLKERVSPLRWAAGGGRLYRHHDHHPPRWRRLQLDAAAAAGLVASNAWFQVLTSKLAKTEDPMTMHLYTGWVGAAGIAGAAFCLDVAGPGACGPACA
jgi:drug/metabolite transporter (DMT)-like permease